MTEAIESITAAVAQSAAAAAPAGGNGPGVASNYDMRDFAAAMARNGGAASTAPAVGVEAGASVQAGNKVEGEGMRTLFSVFDHLNGSADKVQGLAKAFESGTDLSPSQIVRMTMASHEFMFQSQLTSNVANRTSDGVQQLFRQQS